MQKRNVVLLDVLNKLNQKNRIAPNTVAIVNVKDKGAQNMPKVQPDFALLMAAEEDVRIRDATRVLEIDTSVLRKLE